MKEDIVPVIFLRSGEIVLTERFEKSSFIGDPIEIIPQFNPLSPKKLILLDVGATRNGCKPNFELVEELVSNSFFPIYYGGGIQDLRSIDLLFKGGVDKVLINTGALQSFKLLKDATEKYGSQRIILGIDVRKSFWGKLKIYNHKKRKLEKWSLSEYLSQASTIPVGEVFLNFVDYDGTTESIDTKIIEYLLSIQSLPFTIMGGSPFIPRESKSENSDPFVRASSREFIEKNDNGSYRISTKNNL